MRCISLVAGLIAASFIGLPAHAAVVTSTYDYVALFSTGPFGVVVGSVTASFDPAVRGVVAVEAANTSLPGNYPTTGLLYSPNYIAFGNCNAVGCSSSSNNNHYYINFIVGDRGDVLTPINFSYATLLSDVYSSDQLSIVHRSSAGPSVPEPASWALMLVGFSVIGLSLRYKATQAA